MNTATSMSYGAIMSVYEGESCISFSVTSPTNLTLADTGIEYSILNEDFGINFVFMIEIADPTLINLETLTNYNSQCTQNIV